MLASLGWGLIGDCFGVEGLFVGCCSFSYGYADYYGWWLSWFNNLCLCLMSVFFCGGFSMVC